MKILMVLENQFPDDERVEKEALSLIKAGHEVHLLCATLKKERVGDENYKGIRLHRALSTSFLYNKAKIACLRLPFYFMFWKKQVGNLLCAETFDVIHIHDLPLAEVGYWAKKKFGIKFVLDSHENYPYMLDMAPYTKGIAGKLMYSFDAWKRYEREMIAKADIVITVCKEMSDRMNDLVPRTYYHVDNTISMELFPRPEPHQTTAGKIRLLYVGGITYHRGLQNVIKGLALIKDKSKYSLDIYGKGAYAGEIKDLVLALGLEEMVHFPGYLKFPAEAVKMCAYSLGVISNLRSVQTDCSSPNKIYQYFYYGLPVLVSDMNSVGNIVREHQVGVVYKDNSPEDCARKLEQLVTLDLEDMATRAHKLCLEQYNWDVSVKQLIAAYESIR